MNVTNRRPSGFATRIGPTSATTLNLAAEPAPVPFGLHPPTTRGLVSKISSRRRISMPLTRRDFLAGIAGAAAAVAPLAGNQSDSGFRASEEIDGLYRGTITGDALVYTEDYSSKLDTLTLNAIRDSGMTYA